MNTWTKRKALEYTLEVMEEHPMYCPQMAASAMNGDYSVFEDADDSNTAMTSEMAAVCRMALKLPIPKLK